MHQAISFLRGGQKLALLFHHCFGKGMIMFVFFYSIGYVSLVTTPTFHFPHIHDSIMFRFVICRALMMYCNMAFISFFVESMSEVRVLFVVYRFLGGCPRLELLLLPFFFVDPILAYISLVYVLGLQFPNLTNQKFHHGFSWL